MRVAVAQLAPVPGEVAANAAAAREWMDRARVAGADCLVFPELSLTGYAGPPGPVALAADSPVLTALARAAGAMDVVVGFAEHAIPLTPARATGAPAARGARNSAAYLSGGRVAHVQAKTHLPTYRRWDEGRRFAPGDALRAFPTPHGRAAVLICHDAWQPALALLAALDGARLLIVPACSGAAGGPDEAEELARDWAVLLNHHARFAQVHVVFANRVGEEAGARFWGGSRVLDPFGAVLAEAPRDAEALLLADLDPVAVERRRDEIPLVAHTRLDLLAREFSRLGSEGPGR